MLRLEDLRLFALCVAAGTAIAVLADLALDAPLTGGDVGRAAAYAVYIGAGVVLGRRYRETRESGFLVAAGVVILVGATLIAVLS
jgi:uncharacterized ferredoxin-like protein